MPPANSRRRSSNRARDVSSPLARPYASRLTANSLIDPSAAATEEAGLEAVWPLDERHNLDLTPLLAEGVIAALPLMPVCRSACPGLEAAKGPAEAAIDPRWSRLAELRATMFPDVPGTKR